jgi:hypothetical protein
MCFVRAAGPRRHCDDQSVRAYECTRRSARAAARPGDNRTGVGRQCFHFGSDGPESYTKRRSAGPTSSSLTGLSTASLIAEALKSREGRLAELKYQSNSWVVLDLGQGVFNRPKVRRERVTRWTVENGSA